MSTTLKREKEQVRQAKAAAKLARRQERKSLKKETVDDTILKIPARS